MGKQGDQRGIGVEPPPWWVELFTRTHQARQKENDRARADGDPEPYETRLTQLGEILAEIAGRDGKWSHSQVSNFVNGNAYTMEMANAFATLYEIPRFEIAIRADSEERAREIERFAKRFHGPTASGRIVRIDQAASKLQESADRQTERVTSSDGTQSRRPRRPHRSS